MRDSFLWRQKKKKQHKYNIVIDFKLICWICGAIALRDNLTAKYDNSSLCMYQSGQMGEFFFIVSLLVLGTHVDFCECANSS